MRRRKITNGGAPTWAWTRLAERMAIGRKNECILLLGGSKKYCRRCRKSVLLRLERLNWIISYWKSQGSVFQGQENDEEEEEDDDRDHQRSRGKTYH